jgi:hypothetical protein
MHRSGTSALTRALSLLGLDLPTHLMPSIPENRQGFWESFDVMQLNDQALASCDSWWGDWRSIPQEWFSSDECRSVGERLVEILRRDFANSALFVIKDPRICRLAPLWLHTLAELEIEPLVIIPVRHPAEVAASLAIRNGFDPFTSNLLWLRHVLDAEHYTRGITRSVVTFDALMNDWQSTIGKIRKDLRIGWPVSPVSAASEIERFLSPSDRHHSAECNNCALPAWVTAAYEALLSEAEANGRLWGPQDWDRLGGELDRAAAIFGSLLTNKDRELHAVRGQAAAFGEQLQKLADQVTAAHERIRTLEASLDAAGREMLILKADCERARNEILSLRNSTSWRVTAPLRAIAHVVRKNSFW